MLGGPLSSATCFSFCMGNFILKIMFLNFFPLLYLPLTILPLANDVQPNPGPGRAAPCRVLYSNIRGLYRNISELSLVARDFDILVCSETLVTSRRHSSEIAISGFSSPLLRLADSGPGVRGMAVYTRNGFPSSRQRRYECDCCQMTIIRVCGSQLNTYVFGLYRSPSVNDGIYDCILASMASIQAADRKASFVFVGDLNGHHAEWLGSPRTDRHGEAAYDFCCAAGCTQLVSEPTHQFGGVLDLVMTDVPDLVDADVRAPIGNSDHSSISLQITTSQRVPDLAFSKEVYLKNRVDWDQVRDDVAQLDWAFIRASGAATSVDLLSSELQRIVRRRVPVRRIFFRARDKPWFTAECLRARQVKQAAYRRWSRDRNDLNWTAFVESRRLAQACYARAMSNFNARTREQLASATNPHKWWKTLQASLFGSAPTIPPLLSDRGALLGEPIAKANLLSDHFDRKQSRDIVELPATCFPEPRLRSIAFRSKEVFDLLQDLDSNGGSDPQGFFPLFFKEVACVLAFKLAAILRVLLANGLFPLCWRVGHIVPVPKGAPSHLVDLYRPITITPVLSKVYERLVARRLCPFLERMGALPVTQFAYRKGRSTCDALLYLSHIVQSALDRGFEAQIVQLDFSAAFDRINHAAVGHLLSLAGVGGSLLSVLMQFLSQRTYRVSLDGSLGEVTEVVSGVPQGSVLGPVLFILYTASLFEGLESHAISYADDVTLVSVCTKPAQRPESTMALNRDLQRIADWCSLWKMTLNPSKSMLMTVSRSRTPQPCFGNVLISGVRLPHQDTLKILGVTFDCKFTFERHIRSIVSAASQRLGILRKSWRMFQSSELVRRCFMSYMLPLLEYCAPVWASACVGHLRLLDSVVRGASFLCGGVLTLDLWHRRTIGDLCMLFRAYADSTHPLHSLLPPAHVPARVTRRVVQLHSRVLEEVRCRTEQWSRSFVPRTVKAWNRLPGEVFEDFSIKNFKSKANAFLLL